MTRRWSGALLSLAALLLTVFAATGLLLKSGPSCGHDFDFHLVSWMEVARGWHSGLLYPHWVTSANFGAGEPRFIFYPPASWMLGALLGTVFGWQATPWCFTAICLGCAGFTMRRFAAEYLTPIAATAAACLYIANPYMLFVVYERTAYAELMASALLPLLLVFSLRPLPPIAALSTTIAGIWLMNAPSGVMACYALLWIALLRLVSDRRWEAPLRLGGATALGLGLAAFYLVPAAYQQHWVEIARAVGPGMRFQDSFLFHRIGESFHDGVLHTASVIACVLLGVAAVALLLSQNVLRNRRLLWLASLAPLILLLLLPISTPVWRLAPHLNYVQFPWRWLLVLAPVVAFFLGAALTKRIRSPWIVALIVAACIAAVIPVVPYLHQTCDSEDAVSAQVDLMHDGSGEEGTDEYTPRDDDNAEIDQDMPAVRVLASPGAEEPNSGKDENPEWQADPKTERRATITIQQWLPERRAILIDTPDAGFAVIRLMDYPAWTVRRNGVPVPQRLRREDGLLTIAVPQGRSQIQIRWRTTMDVWVGRVLSLLALGAWIFVGSWERRTRTAPVGSMP